MFLMVREIPCAYQTSSLYKFIAQMYSNRLIILLSSSPRYFTDFNVVKIQYILHVHLNHLLTEFEQRFMIF